MTVTPLRATTTRRKRVRRSPESELQQHLTAAADLQRQVQQLELELQEHRRWLLEHLQSTGEKSVTHGGFVASLRSRANWSYSAATQRDMLQLRNVQLLEQSTGKATNTPTAYVALTFKTPK